MKTPHILVMRFSALGDVAMTVPVIYQLARQYPDLRITVLSQPFARPFFDTMAPRVGFMDADIKHEYHGIKGLNKLYRRLTAKNFTAIADLHGVLRTQYLRTRFNIDQFRVEHINKHRREKHLLIMHDHKVMRQLPTSFENYAEVFAKLGYPVRLGDFKSIFPEGGGDLSLLPEGFQTKEAGQRWIGFAPFAAHKGKMLPLEKTVEAIEQTVKRHPSCRVFLFGSKREASQIPQALQDMPQVTLVSQYLSGMDQELILMSHLDVMVTMDSANMHLASLTATPVISVWGATHPYAGFMGWNQREDIAVQARLDCRPCCIYGERKCFRGDYECLNLIQPDDIVRRIEAVISGK